jgi:hypothetical protein
MDLITLISIGALVIVSSISLISLSREWTEMPENRKRQVATLALTILSLVVGIYLVGSTAKANAKAKIAADQKAQADFYQIQSLQQSVHELTQNNQTQYDRNQKELHRVEDQLADIKTQVVTEPLRQKIAALSAELQQSLTPAPKAKPALSFYTSPINTAPVSQISLVAKDNVVTSSFSWGTIQT